MGKLKNLAKNAVSKLRSTGFFSVFLSNIICKILSFLGGIVIVRVLSKNDYGMYAYIINCYSMLMLFGDLGCSAATMQYCNESYRDLDKFNSFFKFGWKYGLLFSAVTALLIFASPLFYPFKHEEGRVLTQMLCFMPFIATANSFLLMNVRIRLENRRFAVINIISSVVHYLIILPLAYFFSVKGAVLSNYAISLTIFVFSFFYTRRFLDFGREKISLSRNEKKVFLKLAAASQLNNGISTGLMLLDVFLIGVIVADEAVISSYKVATTIPAALDFIPNSIMVYICPYFARNCRDIAWVRSSYKKLIAYCTIGNLFITSLCIACSGWLIPLVFGKQYSDSIVCFIILMLGYFFSASFRTPVANIIYTQHKVGVNIVITIASGLLNCFLDIVLIMSRGSVGAAIATTTVHIAASVFSVAYMRYYLKGASNEENNV